jgi:hypothetical protein
MKEFEYEVTKHPAEGFTRLAYFCSEEGECSLGEIPDRHFDTLKEILNKGGGDGWELVQIGFGTDGIVAFWKRVKRQ